MSSAPITAETSDVTAALAIGCPILVAVRAAKPTLSTTHQAAAAALALACPPNAPPTSAVVAVVDPIFARTKLAASAAPRPTARGVVGARVGGAQRDDSDMPTPRPENPAWGFVQ